jgi:hypothetical protein
VCSSPLLIAAYHVLHRLLDPRHPPCALNCFKKIEIVVVLPPLSKIYFQFYNFSHYVKDLVVNVTPARLMTLYDYSVTMRFGIININSRRCSGCDPSGPKPHLYVKNLISQLVN